MEERTDEADEVSFCFEFFFYYETPEVGLAVFVRIKWGGKSGDYC